MNLRLAVLLLVGTVAVEVNGGCLCGFGEGRDMCHRGSSSDGKCGPLVVRPAKLQRLSFEELSKPRVVCKQVGGSSVPTLKPVGDLCSCRQSIVVPANVPRPACKKCGSSSSSSASSSSTKINIDHSKIYSAASSGTVYHHESPTYYHPGSYAVSAAADPVSLSIAYNMQNKDCGVHEGRLAFGFRKLPIDGSKSVVVKNIPEENLFKMNGQIVELKPIKCSSGKLTVDEEALEQLAAAEFAEELKEQEEEGGYVKKLSYGEIGFRPCKIKSVPMVEVHHQAAVEDEGEEKPKTYDCDDGFVPGNVIIKNTPIREVYVPSPGVPLDCADGSSEELVMPLKYKAYSASSSSSSSSSSCSSSASHSYYI